MNLSGQIGDYFGVPIIIRDLTWAAHTQRSWWHRRLGNYRKSPCSSCKRIAEAVVDEMVEACKP